MEDVRIKLSALWVARMLAGLQGDVLRFMQPGIMEQMIGGEVEGMRMTHELLLIVVGLLLNALTVWYAWRWQIPEAVEVRP